MPQRFYIEHFRNYWSLSKKGYLKFLQDGAASIGWDLSLPEYEAREIKKPPKSSNPIGVTDFKPEHYKQELEEFLKTGKQTGFVAPNDDKVYHEQH